MNSENVKNNKLRKKAEEIDKDRFYPIDDLSKDELIHELRVHQIELELQNEELKESQIKLSDSQNKYFELYNFAQAGYFTLDKNGLILDVNLAGARMLGVPKRNLINRAFIRCIEYDYRNEFHHHINKYLETETKHSTELKLLKKNDNSFYANLETINILDENENFKESRITITDITDLKKTEKKLIEYKEILEKKVKKRTEKLNKNLEELSNTEKLLSDVTNLSSDVIYVKDRQSHWIFINPALEQIIGKTANDLLGKNDFEIYSNPKIGKTILETDNRIMDSCQEETLEEIVETQNGTRSFISVKTPRFNENDEVIGIVGISHDITERKKAEKELKLSEKKYHSLYTSMNEGVALHKIIYNSQQLAIDYIITNINPAYEYILDLKRSEVVGKKASELYGSGNAPYMEIYVNVVETGTPTEFETYFEPMDKYFRISVTSPEKGKFATIFEDITERKKAEETLIETLKKYNKVNRTLVALRHSSFVMMHATNEISYLEDVCKILVDDCGYSMVWIGLTDKESKKVNPVVYAGFEEDYLKTLNITLEDTEYGHGPTGTAIRTRKICICENMLTDPKFKPWREEATKRGYASSIVLPLISDDNAFGALNIYSEEHNPFSEEEKDLLKELTDDISYGITSLRLRIEHKKAEKELKESLIEVERSNVELEQFAYITSHDLREPLRMITSFLQLLERRYADKLDEDANDFIGFAVDGAKRLDAMINDILIYSRVSNKDRNLTTVDFNEVIKEVYVNLAASIEKTNAEITYDSLPSIIIDKQLMTQLFQNLISNAIKYRSEETPKIHISVKKEDKQYLFSIKDNGIGIDPKHLERIFTIFQRLHSDREYEGTGIGLAIAQKIVHQQGGEIWTESQPGQGSTFFFTILIKNNL
jgi:PAS domain S-box-containing protein